MNEQEKMIHDFYAELIRANIHFRNAGLTAANRASAFITSALAVADIDLNETHQVTLTEEQFLTLARTVYRAVREGQSKVLS